MIIRTFAALLLFALTLPALAVGQVSAYDVEISPRIAAIRHEFAGITATHLTWGLQVTPIRLGPVGVGVSLDAWRDHIPLGSTFSNRTVRANFFVYGLEIDTSAGDFGGTPVVISARAGAETIRFGSRYEATGLFPRYSNSPSGSVGIGTRVPLIVARNALLLRIETRARATYSEIFDPLGFKEGRELLLEPVVSIGLSYRG